MSQDNLDNKKHLSVRYLPLVYIKLGHLIIMSITKCLWCTVKTHKLLFAIPVLLEGTVFVFPLHLFRPGTTKSTFLTNIILILSQNAVVNQHEKQLCVTADRPDKAKQAQWKICH